MRANQHTSGNHDQPALDDEVLQELERIDQSLLDELVGDTRLSSGVPSEQRGSDLDFIKMSGLTRPLADHPGKEEPSAPRYHPPVDFYDEGVDDVDQAPSLGTQGIRHGAEGGSPIAELKDIVEELSREPAAPAPPSVSESPEPDSAPTDAFPEEFERSEESEERDLDTVLTAEHTASSVEPIVAPVEPEPHEETALHHEGEIEGVFAGMAPEPEQGIRVPQEEAAEPVLEIPAEASIAPELVEEAAEPVVEIPAEAEALAPEPEEEAAEPVPAVPAEVSFAPELVEETAEPVLARADETEEPVPPSTLDEVEQAEWQPEAADISGLIDALDESAVPWPAEEMAAEPAERSEEPVLVTAPEVDEAALGVDSEEDLAAPAIGIDGADGGEPPFLASEEADGLWAPDADQEAIETPAAGTEAVLDAPSAYEDAEPVVAAAAAVPLIGRGMTDDLTASLPPDMEEASLPPLTLSEAEQLLDELQAQERDVPRGPGALAGGSAVPPSMGGPALDAVSLAAPRLPGSAPEPDGEDAKEEIPDREGVPGADYDPSERVFRRSLGHRGRHRSRGRRRLRRYVTWGVGVLAAGSLIGFVGFKTYEWAGIRLATPAKQLAEAGKVFSEGDYRTAADMYSRFAAEHRDDPSRPEAQFRAALAAGLAGDDSPRASAQAYERAVEMLRQFLKGNPAHVKAARAENLLGILLYKLGRYEESIDILSSPELRLRDPEGALPAIRTLACAYAAIGDYDSAASRYTQAAGLDGNPCPDEDHLNLGSLYESAAERAATDADRRRYQELAATQWERAAQVPAIDPARKSEIAVKLAVLREKLAAAVPVADDAAGSPEEAERVPEIPAGSTEPGHADEGSVEAAPPLEAADEAALEDTGDTGAAAANEETDDAAP